VIEFVEERRDSIAQLCRRHDVRRLNLPTERMIRSPHFRGTVDATRPVVYEDRSKAKAA